MNLLTPGEVAETLKVSPETIRRFLREGEMKGIKVGRHWRIKEEDLKDYIDQN